MKRTGLMRPSQNSAHRVMCWGGAKIFPAERASKRVLLFKIGNLAVWRHPEDASLAQDPAGLRSSLKLC